MNLPPEIRCGVKNAKPKIKQNRPLLDLEAYVLLPTSTVATNTIGKSTSTCPVGLHNTTRYEYHDENVLASTSSCPASSPKEILVRRGPKIDRTPCC